VLSPAEGHDFGVAVQATAQVGGELMTNSIPAEFTVSDLVCGWDDVRLLLRTTDADEVWEVVSAWPAQRLATALVAAVTVVRPDGAAVDSWPDATGGAATGHVSGVCGSGHMSGQRAAAERPW
jgi:hypothetical protein